MKTSKFEAMTVLLTICVFLDIVMASSEMLSRMFSAIENCDENMALNGSVIKSFHVGGKMECALLCLGVEYCKSVNIGGSEENSLVCELNSDGANGGCSSLIPRLDWSYYEKPLVAVSI